MFKQVQICDACKGTGWIKTEVCTNHHKGDSEDVVKRCWQCLGSGRIILKTITTILPYTQKEWDKYE
jgi:DnaJ-class molecular chaperone